MEYTQWVANENFRIIHSFYVLILVVMEYTQWEKSRECKQF